MKFKGADILSVKQFNRGDIDLVLKAARKMEPFALKKKFGEILKGYVMASLFYEPSTRTRLSFEASMVRLGGSVISVTGQEFSSLSKGETLQDTGKIVSMYADVIVVRHGATGAPAKLADGASVPVINAGDGIGEHPTQALLDLYTIQKERGKIDGLKIGLVGDLKFGRTVHSLSQALSHFNVELVFISPPELKMPEDITFLLREKGIQFTETSDLIGSLKELDVCYMTRIQQERFSDKEEYEKLKNVYVLTKELVTSKNNKLTIMHPLPRIGEIKEDVDELKTAAYFRQAQNGIAVRMALLSLVLGQKA